MKNRCLVIIPTYNESMNVKQLAPVVLAVDPAIDILFIDDNSPDKTGALIKRMMRTEERLHLLERPGKLGLGTAYVVGFRWALDHGYSYVFEMDADFSHNPCYLGEMLAVLRKKKADVVVGSRYIHGVSVAHWPIKRLLLSKLANVYASLMTGVPVKDLTAGYVGYRREVLAAIRFDEVRSSGYSFQVELKYRCHSWGFRIREVPIIFADRTRGESKISRNIVYEAILRCLALRFSRNPAKKKLPASGEQARTKKG